MPLVVSVKRWRVARVRKKRKTLVPIRREKVGLDLRQQARHLCRRVLAVGVEVGAAVVALAQGIEVARLQRRAEPLVEGEGGDEDAALARPRRRRVGRAVVDDEDVGPWEVLADVGDDRGDRGLLVPGRDEDKSSHTADSPTWPSRRRPPHLEDGLVLC